MSTIPKDVYDRAEGIYDGLGLGATRDIETIAYIILAERARARAVAMEEAAEVAWLAGWKSPDEISAAIRALNTGGE